MLDWAEIRERPFSYYAGLRALPVGEASGPVVLTRHRDVAGALRDPRLSHWSEGGDTRFKAVMGRWVALMDPRRGAALRTHVIAEMGPERLAALMPGLAAFARGLLDARKPSDPLDAVGCLATPFAREVAACLFGVPDAGKPAFYRLLDDVQASLFELLTQDDAARGRLGELGQAVEELARRPDAAGITAAIRRAQADGDRIDQGDLGAFTAIFLFAAFDNVGRFLGLAAHCLAERPAAWARLRAAGGPDDTAIDELLRFDGPVQFVQLIAREPLRIAEREIAPGEIVLAGIAGANRDPEAFDRPDELDLGRTPNPHLALGTGAMRCIGHALARLEARLMLAALIEHMPDAAVLTPPPPRRGPPVLRGFEKSRARAPGGSREKPRGDRMTRAALVCYSPNIAVPDAAPDNMLGQFPSYGIRRVVAAAVSDKRLADLEIEMIERRDPDAAAYVDAIVAAKPDIVGFATYVWSSLLFTEVARELRLRMPECRIVFGGPSAHPDVFALPCYRGAGRWIDALVVGDGEESFADILALGATREALSAIPGLALPEGEGWVRTPPRRVRTDLDGIASPFQLGLMPATGVAYLETFRGCPLSCRFCQWGTDIPGAVFSRDYLERELRALAALSPGVTYLVDAGLNLNAKAFRNLTEAAEFGFFERTSLLCEVYPHRLKDIHLDFLRRCAHAHSASASSR